MASSLRRPLGLFLSGGGALGCWQVAALRRLVDEGLSFDHVMGVSVGALTGAYYAMGGLEPWYERWAALRKSVLKFSPRLKPFSLFSEESIFDLVDPRPDAALHAELRCRLTVVSAVRSPDERIYATFCPGGAPWDAPIKAHLAGSCAIPGVFPSIPVRYRGRVLRLVDGGLPFAEPIDMSPLADCADVLVLETTPPPAARAWSRWVGAIERVCDPLHRSIHRLMGRDSGPRVLRLFPSRPLRCRLLDFREDVIQEGLRMGDADAVRLLREPLSFQLTAAAAQREAGLPVGLVDNSAPGA